MMKFRSIFVDCAEANLCCDKAQYDEASFSEKIKIHIHNFFCKPCKKYTEDNNKLSALIKKANLKSCSEKEKNAWRSKIEEEITK